MPPRKREEIARELNSLGLRRGDCVMMHSWLSALGPVDGGAETVVDAIRDAIGSDGTLIVPAFRDNVWEKPDDFTNSGCDCSTADGLCHSQQAGFQGVIAESVRRRPGSLRSCHPTHSWVALGPAERHHNHCVPGGRIYCEFPGIVQDVCQSAGILLTGRVGKSTSGLMRAVDFDRFLATVMADDPFCFVLRPPERDCVGPVA